jgi:hypothetical protein
VPNCNYPAAFGGDNILMKWWINHTFKA